MDNHLTELEADAVDRVQHGDFKKACEIYEQLTQSIRSDPVKNLFKFNMASCHASLGDHTTALSQLVAIGALGGNDTESLHNAILCLNRLSRHDLALPLLDKMARVLDPESTRDEILVVQLLLDCMNHLRQQTLNRKQCDILERLLGKFRTNIIDLHGESVWTEKLAHVLFLADTRFEDSLILYETLLGDGEEDSENSPRDLLKVDAAVLANLCVSYILTGRNRDAEDLIKETDYLEKAGAQSPTRFDGSSQSETQPEMSRLTRLNLAIGTLYCVKGNHEFGLSRVFGSLEPMDKNLTTQTWRQAKECILSTLDKHCKQLIFIKDELFDQMISFLIQCETRGVLIKADEDERRTHQDAGKNSVTYEARYLRSIILTLIND
jgi:tetratricopeptide (TPR) repeat protein